MLHLFAGNSSNSGLDATWLPELAAVRSYPAARHEVTVHNETLRRQLQ